MRNFFGFTLVSALVSACVTLLGCSAAEQGQVSEEQTDTASEALALPPTRCEVYLQTCLLHPNPGQPGAGQGPFLDPDVQSQTNPARCAQRASEWASYCGNNRAGNFVETSYFSQPNYTSYTSTYAVVPGCQIYAPMCNAIGQTLNLDDAYDGANVNPTRCLQRAQEYHSWCGHTGLTDANHAVQAWFYTSSNPMSVAYISVPANPDPVDPVDNPFGNWPL